MRCWHSSKSDYQRSTSRSDRKRRLQSRWRAFVLAWSTALSLYLPWRIASRPQTFGRKLCRTICAGNRYLRSDICRWGGRNITKLPVSICLISTQNIHAYLQMVTRFAPFDEAYGWANSSTDAVVYDSTITQLNSYRASCLLFLFNVDF